jgi:hypothetical protein
MVVGHGTQVAAKRGEQANVVAHDLGSGKFDKAVTDTVVRPIETAAKEIKGAADATSHGQIGQPLEHVGRAESSLSPGSGSVMIDAAKAGEAAAAHARGAVQEAANGRLGNAGQKAGDAVSSVGDAVKQIDADKSEKLKATGNDIAEKSAEAQTIAQTVHGLTQ